MHTKKTALNATVAVSLALASLGGSAALSSPRVFAATTIDTLASQIVSLGIKAHDGGSVSTLVQPIIQTMSQSSFDWNLVLFGTDTLTPSQQKTASALTPDIRELATFSVTTQSTAATLINDVIKNMQNLNPGVQTTDVLNFLQNMESASATEVLNIVSLQQQNSGTVTRSQLESAMHSFFDTNLGTASAAIQGIFTPSGPTSSTAGGGTSSGASGGTGGTGLGGGTTSGSSMPGFTLLQQELVTPAGTTMTANASGTTVTLVVPENAFNQSEQLSLTMGSITTVPAANPGIQPRFAFGVSFNGPAPSQALTLTIQNPTISVTDEVYKVQGTNWIPVKAEITQGQAVISFTNDPDFVIAEQVSANGQGQGTGGNPQGGTSGSGSAGAGGQNLPKLLHYQRLISLPGSQPVIVPSQVKNGTTYMPIWYVMNMLKSLQIKSHWDGVRWQLTTPSNVPLDYSKVNLGVGRMGIDLNGTEVLKVTGFTAVDPTSTRATTYMPIYDVMLVLQRLHIQSKWDGTTWSLTQK